MARKAATQEVDETVTDTSEPQLSVVQNNTGTTSEITSKRTRRTFNYDPQALGVAAVEDEPEDFVPVRTRTSEKMDQVRWLEDPLAASYENNVWKGVTVANENVDTLKQGIIYAVNNLFDKSMGISFNLRDIGNGNTRVSFKMTDKRPFGGRRKR